MNCPAPCADPGAGGTPQHPLRPDSPWGCREQVPREPRRGESALPPVPTHSRHTTRIAAGEGWGEHPTSRSRQWAQGHCDLLIAARQEWSLQNTPHSSPHDPPIHTLSPFSIPAKEKSASCTQSLPGLGTGGRWAHLAPIPSPGEDPSSPALTSRRCCCRIFFIPESCCYALPAPTLVPLAFSGDREGEGGAGKAITGKEGCQVPASRVGGGQGRVGGSRAGGKGCLELRIAVC